jgi:hypothetical protein
MQDMVGVVAVGGSMSIAIFAIIGGTIRSVFANKQREESRREIAAYVAEGSMTPEDGEKLINAGPKRKNCCS